MLKPSMRMLLLSVAAMTVGIWWELGGHVAAQACGCGSALCSGMVTAVAPTYNPAGCAIGFSNASYGGSAQVGTGLINPCMGGTTIGQVIELWWATPEAPISARLAPANRGSTPAIKHAQKT